MRNKCVKKHVVVVLCINISIPLKMMLFNSNKEEVAKIFTNEYTYLQLFN